MVASRPAAQAAALEHAQMLAELGVGQDRAELDARPELGRDEQSVHALPAETSGLRQRGIERQPAERMASLGFDLGNSTTPIIPVTLL